VLTAANHVLRVLAGTIAVPRLNARRAAPLLTVGHPGGRPELTRSGLDDQLAMIGRAGNG
jgi:hypothetical protein